MEGHRHTNQAHGDENYTFLTTLQELARVDVDIAVALRVERLHGTAMNVSLGYATRVTLVLTAFSSIICLLVYMTSPKLLVDLSDYIAKHYSVITLSLLYLHSLNDILVSL